MNIDWNAIGEVNPLFKNLTGVFLDCYSEVEISSVNFYGKNIKLKWRNYIFHPFFKLKENNCVNIKTMMFELVQQTLKPSIIYSQISLHFGFLNILFTKEAKYEIIA